MPNNNFWYIASYPKSGNTWVRVFLSELISLENKKGICQTHEFKKTINLNSQLNTGIIMSNRTWFDDQIGIDSSDLTNEEIDMLRSKTGLSNAIYSESHRYHKIHDAYRNLDNEMKSCVSKGCSGVLYLVRNPEDIAVSLHHFTKLNIDETINFMTNKDSYLCKDNRKLFKQLRQFLGSWDFHVESWLNQVDIPLLLIRYEDLKLDKEKTFYKISKFFKLSSNKTNIEKAILNSEFKVLQKKENESGFFERPRSCNAFFRKGEIGEGEKVLNEIQKNKIRSQFKSTMVYLRYI